MRKVWRLVGGYARAVELLAGPGPLPILHVFKAITDSARGSVRVACVMFRQFPRPSSGICGPGCRVGGGQGLAWDSVWRRDVANDLEID